MSQESPHVPLAIVGIGARFPKAEDHRRYWENISAGKDCIVEIPESHWRVEDFYDANPGTPDMTYAQRGGFLDAVDFDPLKYGVPPRTVEVTDTSQLLGMVVAREAMRDAGYENKAFDRDRCSVILGVTGALELVIPLGARLSHPIWKKVLRESGLPEDAVQEISRRIADAHVPWREDSFPGLLGNVVAGRIASHLDVGGTNCVADAACASTLAAVHLAALELSSGRSDMVLTGGIDTFNDIFMYMCFSKTPALSKSGNARPFSLNGDGTILGEGVGMLVLKRLADAERDGDRIYAVLKGLGSSSDGKGQAVYAPSAKGQAKALRKAYGHAQVDPSEVTLIEAHGTGTKVGDSVEARALTEVFRAGGREGQPWCAIGSVKSQIGHTKAAAGAAGLIKAALALHHKVLPPTIKVDQPVEALKPGTTPFYVNTRKRPWLPESGHGRRAGVSAFGFGGSNFHAVLEEYGTQKRETNFAGAPLIVAFSAQDEAGLKALLEAMPTDGKATVRHQFAAESCAGFNPSADQRLLLVVAMDGDWNAARQAAIQQLQGQQAGPEPDFAIFYSSGAVETGQTALLFPGQGTQYLNMGLDIACAFPAVQEVLETADKIFEQHQPDASQRLSDYIYPHGAFDAETEKQQQAELTQTQVAQPAIGAVSAGMWQLMAQFGIRAQAACGHSFGELTALYAAGRLSLDDFLQAACLRGRLMRQQGADLGGMLAVSCRPEHLQDVLDQVSDVTLANHNAPKQCVLAGSHLALEQAATLLDQRKLSYRKLQVGAAFHSALVADAAKPFSAALKKMDMKPGNMPVYANTTAQAYPDTASQAQKLLGQQLAKPVAFVDQIETMYQAGVRTFVETGPGGRMGNLVRSILGDRPHLRLSFDLGPKSHNGLKQVARALAQLAAWGHAIDLKAWHPAPETEPMPTKKRLTVPVSGANVVQTRLKQTERKPRQWVPADQVATPVKETNMSQTDTQSTPTATAAATPPPVAPRVATQQPQTHDNSPAPMQGPALQMAREHMAALQQLQTDTARLHQQFLEGQESARRNMQRLLDQQQHILAGRPLPSQAVAAASAPGAVPAQPSPAALPVTSQPAAPVPQQTAQPHAQSAPAPSAHVPSSNAPNQPKPVAETVPAKSQAAPEPQVTPAAGVTEANALSDQLLAIVAEKTGYPAEMLNLEMSLEGDLGIDSIKRVEILSALQDAVPGLPEFAADQLSGLQSLGDIDVFFREQGVGNAAAATATVSTDQPSEGRGDHDRVLKVLLETIAEKTGYPVDSLNGDMQLDSELGVDSIKRVEILSAVQDALPQAIQIEPDALGQLHTPGEIAQALAGAPHAAPNNAVAPDPATPASSQASDGVLPGSTEVTQKLLGVVAEKTGYPADSLTMSMNMDADLGIDSIKRVEILSAVQDVLPGVEAADAEHLGSFQTLGDVRDFLVSQFQIMPSAKSQPEQQADIMPLLLDIVAEKTGYPAESLSADMDLEGDLGIDSIKRVEILSALRDTRPDLPEIDPSQMGDWRTLGQVAASLGQSVSAEDTAATASTAKVDASPVRADQPDPQQAASVVSPLPAASSKTLSADATLSRMIPTLQPQNEKLRSLKFAKGSSVIVFASQPQACEGLIKSLEKQHLKAMVVTPQNVADFSVPTPLAGLILLGIAVDESFIQPAFQCLRKLSPSLGAKSQTRVLMSVSGLGGTFGLSHLNREDNPSGGGLAGLVKTAAHEWPELTCKAVDLDPREANDEMWDQVADLFSHTTPVEVSLLKGERHTLALANEPIPADAEMEPIEAGDAVLVTGGARGVTAAAALELARRFRARLILLGRTPLDEQPEPTWLAGAHSEAEIKKAILGQPDQPKNLADVQKLYHRIAAQREARANMQAIREAGGQVQYRAVDVRDSQALQELVSELRASYGSIRGLVHGAGVLADRRIEDKRDDEFERVFETKVLGLNNLLRALEEEPLRFMALFSSTTARLGRVGQCDYAAANEVLNKVAQMQARLRPKCRVVSLNWGPWAGGMVNPSLEKIFAAEGVGLIPLSAGARHMIREISLPPGQPVEVVVMVQQKGRGPVTTVSEKQDLQESFRINLNTVDYPFLTSHVIDNKAVLPMALAAEWLCQGALHHHPGFKVSGFENLRVQKGVVLEQGQTASLAVCTTKGEKHPGLVIVQAVLRGSDAAGRPVDHARATVRLARKRAKTPEPVLRQVTGGYDHSFDKYYGETLFHGSHFHGVNAILGCDEAHISAGFKSAPRPSRWMSKPLRSQWVSDPLALDCAFQTMIIWCDQFKGMPSLPCYAATFEQFQPFPLVGSLFNAQITDVSGQRVTADFEWRHPEDETVIARMRGYECILDAPLREAFARNSLVETVSN